jgi:hypothetical protein
MNFNQVFDSAKSFFDSGVIKNVTFRKTQIEQLLRMCQDNFEDLMEIFQRDNQILSFSEFEYAISELENILENYENWISEKVRIYKQPSLDF